MGNSTTRNVRSETRGKNEQIGAAQDADELTRPTNFRQISAWSLGSLSERLNWSFNSSSRSTHSFSKPRNKSFKQHSSSSRKNSKTSWPVPLTDSIFQSHFKRFSKNDNYIVDKVIAKGAFGIVFKILDKNNSNLEYALKVLSKSKVIQSNSVQQLKDEVDIQKLCGHHPFIVKQLDSWQNRRNLHILLEYIPGGELFTKICRFPFELVRLYVAEISLAIDFLHNAGIIYRDVKPENILLTADYHIKLTDFGLSKWLKFGERTKTMCGTLQYMEEEYFKMNARSQVFDLCMDGRQVDEACASIFHTVLFHRCLGKFMYTGDATYSIGTVGYSDVDCDFIDFTYVCCTSDSLHRTVKRAINTFSEKLRSNDSTGSGQISLEFFQRKKNRWPFQAECIPWEVWTVRLDLVTIDSEDQRQVYRETVSEVLSDKVFYITEVMNRHDYVPKMPSQNELDLIFDTSYPDIQPYLFKFDFSTSDTPVPSVSNTMKKIFKETLAL